MPRVKLGRDPVKETVKRAMDLVFGTGANKRTYAAMSAASNIPGPTLRGYAVRGDMPVSKMIQLMKAEGMTKRDWMYIWDGEREA